MCERDAVEINYKIVRDIGAGCGEEALSIVSKMNDWAPAQQDECSYAV